MLEEETLIKPATKLTETLFFAPSHAASVRCHIHSALSDNFFLPMMPRHTLLFSFITRLPNYWAALSHWQHPIPGHPSFPNPASETTSNPEPIPAHPGPADLPWREPKLYRRCFLLPFWAVSKLPLECPPSWLQINLILSDCRLLPDLALTRDRLVSGSLRNNASC